MQFRKWATGIIEQFTIKAYVMDDERIKAGGSVLIDQYFEEQLQRVREIRISERKFYQKITDIYATSVDYNPQAAITQEFFATVQNKVHYAIHGHTAAELIKQRADSSQPNMGLTNWSGARIRKSDVGVAKNNLAEQYLVFAEGQAARRIAMTMKDWITKLEGFLTLNDREILRGAGQVSAELAKSHAEAEFSKFRVIDDARIESDFDRMVKSLPAPRKGKQ